METHSRERWRRDPTILALSAILLLHGALLAVSIPDYRVTIDSAYHVSMGREYGEHGLVAWDRINFGPRGRPNLQGPLLHAAIGAVGRLLGGRGDDYVLANAILAVIQWVAAMGTVAFFAFRLRGKIAMLLAAALLSGAGFAGSSFAIGIPSGWLFTLTPWAIWFFQEDRIVVASVAAALAIYSHIGGYMTTPVGMVIAALLTSRWRELLRCGAITAALTLPYTIHIIRYAGWLSGMKGHAAILFDPMLDLLAIAGAIRILTKPRENPFMAAWLLAPVAWLIQDPGRFLLQWPLAGSVAAGILLANTLEHLSEARQRVWYAIGLATLATVLPFGLPSVAGEAAWAAGNHYPIAVNWKRTRNIARTIDRAGLTHTLIADYSPELCPAIAVYADISCEKGDWIEVQPRLDSADSIPAAQKTYVVPIAADDHALVSLESSGWITAYPVTYTLTSVPQNSLLRLVRTPSLAEASVFASATVAMEASWLGLNAVENAISIADLPRISSASGRDWFRRKLADQRTHAGRLELACLVYAWALEAADPQDARAMRWVALNIGVLASYLSDDFAIDFLGRRRLAAVRDELLQLATRSNRVAFDPSHNKGLLANFKSLIMTALNSRGDMFTGRPAGDWVPWLFG
ncbi:MAG: hypothetical protein JO166_04980 [Deltaproteobacteria bacterium]|nr:hypothetical protein [Deltaproteobacteria bacterium]